jgi:hypothetical protein
MGKSGIAVLDLQNGKEVREDVSHWQVLLIYGLELQLQHLWCEAKREYFRAF